ncbi:EKC/KEOPS complex subunit Lage3-like [Microtus ochrogaster]|uniref:L antigen family member 3 n=1 Tax=Microtus ochrogaster TaxID=79684 RepID=A0A8J6G199_MICOH|nr:EKC/KEOPS complex subunit Lage3-like [Microtus ochrogaster]KAH0502460.1 EKC/KEOPS complex subunit Lage3 [Microtus ochrogaster]
MQDPGENKSCKVGGEEEECGQHTTENPDEQASSQISEAENDNGNSPRESHPQDSGSQAVQCSLDSRSPVEARVVAEQAPVAPQEEQVPIIPGPSGDAATTAGSRLLEFSVTVPFRTAVEANIACRSLASNVQQQQVMVQHEFTVNDSTLTVRWTTEDPVLFRTSINAFLDQLSLVMRNIPRPVFMAVFKQGRGRNNES